ncbi:MAG: type II toxin-antitoxin system VapC family toxin [Dermatophilaceae bacterium]|nr:type II toxin-antitoxin system VapC family toxin [Intrasporangiaceae bacterium]
MREVFLDSSVLLLAAGAPHPLRDSCRAIVDEVASGRVRGHLSVEAIQEFVHHRMRRADPQAVPAARAISRFCILHPFDQSTLDSALDLIAVGSARGRDAVHAASALKAGFAEICSADTDFDHVPGLARLDPKRWVHDG